MHNQRFFDQTLAMIEHGALPAALPMLAGTLYNAHADPANWAETRAVLHRHPLHSVLLQDPFTAHSASRPRGYPGDAGLIDLIYDMQPPASTSAMGRAIFDVTIKFQAPEGVRQRRLHAETVVAAAQAEGQRVLVLAGGHLREADPLIGRDLRRFTVVDQDAQSLAQVHAKHGVAITLIEANVFHYLRRAAKAGEQFDLIYTLGLTDYLDTRAMQLLHQLMKACLAPHGTLLLANFGPHHLGTGWMDAVMDWRLVYREEAELETFALNIGMNPVTWRDPTGSVVWCQMAAPL